MMKKVRLALLVGCLSIVASLFFLTGTTSANQKTNLLKPSYTKLNGKKVVDWKKPTAKKYVDLTNVPAKDLKIVVNQKHQTVNIYKNNKLIEQFLCSTGKRTKETATPVGTFAIEPEHGTWFYNAKPDVAEGARNFVSFKDHGVYLFHSVVMNQDNQPIMSRQGRLGHPNSHGCIQMSLPDNVYFYNTFSQPDKVGTKVVIEPFNK